MPAVTLLLTTLNFDYLFHSREQLPIAITAWTVYAITLIAKNPTRPVIYATGLLTGALPFCKIQVGPAGVYLWFIAAVVLVFHYKTARASSSFLFYLILGGITVPALILIPVIFAGSWQDFIDLYIQSGLVYKTSAAGPSGTPSNLEIFCRLITNIPEFFAFTAVSSGVGLFHLIQAIPHLPKTSKQLWLTGAATLGFALVMSYSVYRTGFGFPHYTHLLIIPITLLAACFALLVPTTRNGLVTSKAYIPFVLCLLLFFSVQTAIKESRSHQQLLKNWGSGTHPIAEILNKFVGPGDTMCVWGYAPKFHVFSGIAPASRFLQTVIFMGMPPGTEDDPKANFQRFLADLERSKPALFIDAPDEFLFPSPNTPHGIMARHFNVKPLAHFIQKSYQLVFQINIGPDKVPIMIYRRKPGI
jgi:hypothetical protein